MKTKDRILATAYQMLLALRGRGTASYVLSEDRLTIYFNTNVLGTWDVTGMGMRDAEVKEVIDGSK
jgi:hypothetical protein